LLAVTGVAAAQKTKPCTEWQTDFVQIEPKSTDGTHINKYVASKLAGDTSLKSMATCMVGVKIFANCNGEFDYVKMDYPNNPALKKQCALLLKKTETIINGLKTLAPAKIGGQAKDFAFKLVVKVKRNGEPVAELLY